MKSPHKNNSATPFAKAAKATAKGATAKTATGVKSGQDQTEKILAFLGESHGNIQVNPQGEFYFGEISTLSLHLLLSSGLPEKETLWAWYHHFDKNLSQSIYQTLPPLRDQEFLEILRQCDFTWDEARVAKMGLLFLASQRELVMEVLEKALTQRLEAYHTMSDGDLKKALTPENTRTEVHLRRLVRKIRTEPVNGEFRAGLYDKLDSDYQRATARQFLDEATSDPFWKDPPSELDSVRARLAALYRILLEASLRLGVYGIGDPFGRGTASGQQQKGNKHNGSRSRRSAGADNFPGSVQWEMEAHHLYTLGLKPSSSLEDVRSAYREKVKMHHPDQGGSLQEFLRVQEAYEYLISEAN